MAFLSTVHQWVTLLSSPSLLNYGGVYSTTTGKFTVPIDGVYMFTSTLCASYTSKYAFVDFVADGTVIGKFTAGDADREICFSGSAIARLQKGMQAFLKVRLIESGFYIIENMHHMNSFTGHMIST